MIDKHSPVKIIICNSVCFLYQFKCIILSFVHDQLNTISNEESFLLRFTINIEVTINIELLENLEEMFPLYYMNSVLSAGSNFHFQTHTGVLSVLKRIYVYISHDLHDHWTLLILIDKIEIYLDLSILLICVHFSLDSV